MRAAINKYAEWYLLLPYAAIAVFSICYFNGTGDSGDSINHYLFAKYAPRHPQLYFDHWAKPVFVLLASPFAQFGFTGVKVFNAIVAGFVLLLTHKTAKRLGYAHAALAPLFLLGMPLFYVLVFSGLTEILFALFLITGIYLCCREKYNGASVVISFLPFVRSEGLIMMGVFALYFLYNRKFMALLLLATGHVLYSAAGWFVYGNLLWVFKKIPYAKLGSTYGSGKLTHFVEQLYYVIGLPLYILVALGKLGYVWTAFLNRRQKNYAEETILILLGFVAFFVAHTLFWYLGIFNSMGLKRVLVGVAPLTALMALRGFNGVYGLLDGKFRQKGIPQESQKDTEKIGMESLRLSAVSAGKKRNPFPLIFSVICTTAVTVFPLTSNPAAIGFEKNMRLTAEQLAAQQIPAFINTLPAQPQRYIHLHPYLSEILHIDPFDGRVYQPLSTENISQSRPGDLIIWDRHFAVLEAGMPLQSIQSQPNLKLLKEINTEDGVYFCIYTKESF